MALDPTLRAPHSLAGDAPEQPLALVAVRGAGGGPEHEVVRGGGRDGINQSLKRLLVHVEFLKKREEG